MESTKKKDDNKKKEVTAKSALSYSYTTTNTASSSKKDDNNKKKEVTAKSALAPEMSRSMYIPLSILILLQVMVGFEPEIWNEHTSKSQVFHHQDNHCRLDTVIT
ncbi:hypothetical protein RIF29_26537 [Crotalaria pallida]|uniref:Uncharacterized protein n=1 Tax=Crotalaria pallida TaxID=3830 RepID=A0AAN9I0E9_CROPI